jgi:very-short-patch-repair endonuclease
MKKGIATKENHYAYNKTLRAFARSNRNTATKAEACLWKYVLRAGMMKGYTFRRQRPVMRFIADFMCKELMLVIEVDGAIHQLEETIRKDKKKQHDLEEAGFTVLRFANEEVLHDIENVRRAILFAVETKEQQNNLPPPPYPLGERESVEVR